MAIFLITGKLGAGKSLVAVARIRDALQSGRRVVTNLDLHLDGMFSPLAGRRRPLSVMRIPDKPSLSDLELIGIGNETMDESLNGLIVLDELSSWLNARSWADKSRQEVIDWLVHSRKKGWDVMFICQHLDQLDKQVRTALVEFLVVCRRLDRLKIPGVGRIVKFLTSGVVSGNLPKVHVATVKYGVSNDAPVADRWVYQARDLYAAYDTRQVFSDSYSQGVFSYLTPWHLKGRYLGWWDMNKSTLIGTAAAGLIVGLVFGGAGVYKYLQPKAEKKSEALVVDSSQKVIGVLRDGAVIRRVQLMDGRIEAVDGVLHYAGNDFVRMGDKWIKLD